MQAYETCYGWDIYHAGKWIVTINGPIHENLPTAEEAKKWRDLVLRAPELLNMVRALCREVDDCRLKQEALKLIGES